MCFTFTPIYNNTDHRTPALGIKFLLFARVSSIFFLRLCLCRMRELSAKSLSMDNNEFTRSTYKRFSHSVYYSLRERKKWREKETLCCPLLCFNKIFSRWVVSTGVHANPCPRILRARPQFPVNPRR